VEKAFAGAAKKIEAIYQVPFLAHATMEPMNCTVHVRPDACDIWVGTQVITRAQAAAAQITGLPKEKVKVHNHLIGGGFGRRLDIDGVIWAVPGPRAPQQASSALWAARQSDVKRVVRLSAVRAAHDAPTENSRLHALSDRELEHSGISYTILKPHFFMQSLLMWAQTVAEQGTFHAALGDGKLGMIDVGDIAAVAAKVRAGKLPAPDIMDLLLLGSWPSFPRPHAQGCGSDRRSRLPI
jgi:hypothetical protein